MQMAPMCSLRNNYKAFYSVAMTGLILSCNSGTNEGVQTSNDSLTAPAAGPMLIAVQDDSYRPAFLNEKGDTVIPFGVYEFSFNDTIREIGFAADTLGKIMTLDVHGTPLFEAYNFDNGPDYVEDGLFRMVRDGKIGYANPQGVIVIEPQYSCAYPFEDGKAKVSLECTETIEFEMKKWESDNWFFIDKTGKEVK